MSEQLTKSNHEYSRSKKALVAGLATLALGAGIAKGAESMSSKPTWSKEQIGKALKEQRLSEKRSFDGFNGLVNSLPGTIDSALRQNDPNSAGFMKAKSARYLIAVGDIHGGTTTMRMAYVKGNLRTITIVENQEKPLAFSSLENAEYTRISKEGKGLRITRQSMPSDKPGSEISIGSSISSSYIAPFEQLPKLHLAERRAEIRDLNSVLPEIEGMLTGYAKTGGFQPTSK